MTFGQWLKQAREDRFWSQRDFAKECGSDVNSISHWERGKRRPRRAQFEAVLRALHTTEQKYRREVKRKERPT